MHTLTKTYLKGMKVGHIMKSANMFHDGTIPESWTDNEEIASIVNRIGEEVTESSVRKAIQALETELEQTGKTMPDLDWRDEVRGLIAGTRFDAPTPEAIALASMAEEMWDDDVNGRYGYYHEVCDLLVA
jgi:hypothetical protein